MIDTAQSRPIGASKTEPSQTPSNQAVNSHDIAVIGGGPAGAAVAALLAKEGFDVVLAERTRFPRFHIGESLLPHSMPILEKLGVLSKVEAIGVPKYGADFADPDGHTRHVLFERALRPGPPSAFQVKRSDFDNVLLTNARDQGASVLEETTVKTVDLERQDEVRLEFEEPDGKRRWIKARQVIDASGRDGLLARKFSMRTPNKRHQSAAVFSHYENVPRHEGNMAGNVSIYWFDHGWMWFIPLPNDQMSVGAVCETEYFKSRSVPLEQFLDDTIQRSNVAAARMKAARRIEPVRAASNYSYGADHMCGPNYVLIGDAFAFIDPVFSSGVHIALTSAILAAELMTARLKTPKRAMAAQRKMERRMKRGLSNISWLIYRVKTRNMQQLFLAPRNILGVEQAVISVLAGDFFGQFSITWRYAFFKLIFRLHRMGLVPIGDPGETETKWDALEPSMSR
ncbi:MAG: NAD(P)/FAD-dependent oxidoreductase [Geminicoccaceae bacterium]